jgi:tRNA (guanine26-N2/guanine27-N2)-dimethyltransferase
LYVDLPSLCRTVKSTTPQLAEFRSALAHAGFKVSGTHCSPTGIKTDASMDAVWDIIRCWGTEKGCKPREDSPGIRIMAKQPLLKANFEILPEQLRDKSITRFAPNPSADWGPLSRASAGKRQNRAQKSNEDNSDHSSDALEEDDQEPEKKQKQDLVGDSL